jgi:phytoene desaturase
MYKLACNLGVDFKWNTPVESVQINHGKITSLRSGTLNFEADVVINSADYHYFDQNVLPKAFRSYSASYWDNRVLSPSALIFYLGFNTSLPGILHHTLLFDEDFSLHASQIYDNPQWPQKPSIYISATSKTDKTVAPQGHENLMVLIPVAPGLEDTPAVREQLFSFILQKLTQLTGINVVDHIVFKQSYAHNDFISDYNAFKGNAYGLANTLMQTAFLKPKMQSRKLANLYNTGQLTVPGPGVPPAIISGEVAANEIIKQFKMKKS